MANKEITNEALWNAEQKRAKGAAADTPAFTRKENHTLPYLSLGDTESLFIRVDGYPRMGKLMVAATGASTTVNLLPVTNLATRQPALLVAPVELVAVLGKLPNMIGKRFELARAEDDGMSQYREVQVWEIE